MKSDRPAQLAILALIATCLVCAFVDAPGTFDDYAFIEWAKLLAPNPFTGYARLSHRVALDYPPIGTTLMWLSIKIGEHFDFPDQPSFKIPIAMCTLAAPLVAYTRRGNITDALLLLLIATPFGLILGYTDVVYLPFLLLAFYAAGDENFARAGFLLALSALIKWQPIIFAPLFVAAAGFTVRSLRRFTVITIPTALLIFAILALYGPSVTHVLYKATSDNLLSGQGLNLAWLLSALFEYLHAGGLALQANGAVALLSTPSPALAVNIAMTDLRILFYGCFIATLVIYLMGRKTQAAFHVTALSCAVVQFTVNTTVHENHFFVSIIAAFAAWQAGILETFLFAAIATIGVFNILLFYGFDDGFNFSPTSFIDATIPLALAELVTYALVLKLQIKTCLSRE
jgi:hypothetical protein